MSFIPQLDCYELFFVIGLIYFTILFVFLGVKKAWEVAQAPFMNLLMMGFMMWMAGSTVHLFSIGIAFSALWQPISALRSVGKSMVQQLNFITLVIFIHALEQDFWNWYRIPFWLVSDTSRYVLYRTGPV